MLTLQFAVATLGSDGINRLAERILPTTDGISWVVSWQLPHDNGPDPEIPASLRRNDVQIHIMRNRGLGLNRNNAMSHTDADIVMPTDDDLIYDLDAVREIIDNFEKYPSVDYIVFMVDGDDPKYYPPERQIILRNAPKGLNVTVFEIAYRRTAVENKQIRFDPRFGLGSPKYTAGEDEIFFLSLRRKGLRGLYVPLKVCRHTGKTTGFRAIKDPRIARSMGVVIGMSYPGTAPARIVLKAIRMGRSRQMTPLKALRHLCAGYIDSLFMKRI